MIIPDFDYRKEQHRAIAFIDMKSFYASVECIERGLDPLTTSLCVMSNAANSTGLILASSPTFKRVFGKKMSVEVVIYHFIYPLKNLTMNAIIKLSQETG